MATGKQAGTALSATTWTNVYAIPTGYTWTGVVKFVNRNSSVAKVRLAFSDSTTVANGEYEEYDFPLAPAGTAGNVLVLSGEILQAGKYIMAYSDSSNVDVSVKGIEE